MMKFLYILCASLPVWNVQAFLAAPTAKISHNILYYDYLNKNPVRNETRKDPGMFPILNTSDFVLSSCLLLFVLARLIKNMIFPGIYKDYEDTLEPKQTIKIKTTTTSTPRSRNPGDSFFSQDSKSGSYNMVDPSSAPKEGTVLVRESLKRIAKPANFVAPTPKKAVTVSLGGITVVPGLNPSYKPKKPIIVYEYEASPDCRKVREACSMLDLIVEYRPCPGTIHYL